MLEPVALGEGSGWDLKVRRASFVFMPVFLWAEKKQRILRFCTIFLGGPSAAIHGGAIGILSNLPLTLEAAQPAPTGDVDVLRGVERMPIVDTASLRTWPPHE